MKRIGRIGPREGLPKKQSIRPITELLRETPFRVMIATISDHTAVLVLGHPLPPVGPVVHDAILNEVHALVQRNPGKGGVAVIEVWAPVDRSEAHQMVFREVLEKPLRLSLRPLGNAQGAMRGYLISRGSSRRFSPAHPSVAASTPAGGGLDNLFIPPPLRTRFAGHRVDSTGSLMTFVSELMREAGFSIRPIEGARDHLDFAASLAGARVFVRCYHCEKQVPSAAIDRFGYGFLRSRYDEGLFVSDGSIAYNVRHWERNSRIHLIGRLGLQRFVNAVAARRLRKAAESRAG